MRLRNFALAGGLVIFGLAAACPLHGNQWVFAPEVMAAGHIGRVNAVVNKGGTVISAGDDGFLEVWSVVSGNQTVERFQVSLHRIVAMAGRPDRPEVALIEADGLGLFRVSAWDYRQRRNIFRHEFRNPIVHVSYSMGGSFVIVGGAGATGLVFIDSESGEVLPSPADLGGTVALAVTGRAERNVMLYLSSGFISYRDLDSGMETARFNAPANLSSPVVFGSNRFIAGMGALGGGLLVVDAVTGNVVARDAAVPAGALLCSSNGALYVLINRAEGAELRRKAVNQFGHLVTLATSMLPFSGGERFTAISAYDGEIALGTFGGSLIVSRPESDSRELAAGARTRIIDAAVSGGTIAILGEDGAWGFIPLEYSALANGSRIRLERGGAVYSRVTPFALDDGFSEHFIFWQHRNAQTPPSIRSAVADPRAPGLEGLSFQFPLRQVASYGGRAMFLDVAGNVSVVAPLEEDGPVFGFSSVGLLDGAFIDRNWLIMGRSAIMGGTPFLSINTVTGETVPLAHPAQVAVILRPGSLGDIYAVTVSPQPGGAVTSVLRIDPANVAESERIAYFEGEHSRLSFAQTPAGLATNVGEESASVRPPADASSDGLLLERTPGFPYRLFEGGRNVVSLDRDGNLAWHDSQSGRLLAIFRLHPESWSLQTQRGIARGGF